MIRTATLEVDLDVVPRIANVVARTVVALPPSDADPIWDEMRVLVGGVLISRAFDPGAAIVTGAPLRLTAETGGHLLTEAGDYLTTETGA